MKNILVLSIGFMLVYFIGCQIPINKDEEKEKVKSILDSYITSIETEDMDLYSRLVRQDTSVVYYGSFGKPIIGWNSLKHVIESQNSALSETKISQSDLAIDISDSGELAWATSLWNLKAKMNGEPLELPVRCSWILKKQNNDWQIIHFHKSLSAG